MEEYAFVCGGRFHEQLLYLKKKKAAYKKNQVNVWVHPSGLYVEAPAFTVTGYSRRRETGLPGGNQGRGGYEGKSPLDRTDALINRQPRILFLSWQEDSPPQVRKRSPPQKLTTMAL